MINFNDYVDIDYAMANEDSFEAFEEQVQILISQTEITYYSSAMKFLEENDISLQLSLELANDYGYTLEYITSELLATLLLKDMLQGEVPDLQELWDEENS